MTYSIWLEPLSGDAKHINKTINKLAKTHAAPRFSAHMTLYSGISSLIMAKHAVNQCPKLRLDVRASGISQSDYLWKTVFVNVKKDKNLRHLNSTLQKNLKTKYEFKPHISLIYKRLDRTTKRKIIRDLRIKKSFTFDKITIIKSSKNVDNWKKLYTVRLKPTSNA